jgi:hypothetical protein
MGKSKDTQAGSAGGEAAFVAAVTKARALVKQAREALEAVGLYHLTDEERLHSNGRLRKDEPAAMTSVCDAMDAAPGVFEGLAPRDRGTDPGKVETGPTRAAIEHCQTVAPLVADLNELARDVGDDALASASLAKEVTVPAYAILLANAPINEKVRGAGKKALSFYGSFGLRRAQKKKRAATKEKKAAKTSSK